MKTIKVFNSKVEAELASGFLKGEGITAMIQSDDCDSLYPNLQFASGVKLLVPDEYENMARQLLEKCSLMKEPIFVHQCPACDAIIDKKIEECPSCGIRFC